MPHSLLSPPIRLGPLHRLSLSLLTGTALTSLFGFLYWLIASRLASPAALGAASAAYAILALLQSLADFGLTLSLLHFTASRSQDPALLARTVITASSILCLTAAAAFLLALPWLSPALLPLRRPPWVPLAFLLAALANTLLAVQDASALALGRPRLLFWRHAGLGLLRLLLLAPLLFLLEDDFQALFLASALPYIVAAACARAFILPHILPGFRLAPRFSLPLLAEMLRYGISNHAANLLWGLPPLLLPVICVNRVSPQAAAYFTLSWTMLNLVLLAPRAVAPALVAEASRPGSDRPAQSRRAAALMLRLSLLPIAVLWLFGAGLAGRWFGPAYADETLLRILLLSAFPYIFNSAYIAFLRASEALPELVTACALCGSSVLIFSMLLAPPLGESGVALGWLIGQTLGAAAALPRLWRTARLRWDRRRASRRWEAQP